MMNLSPFPFLRHSCTTLLTVLAAGVCLITQAPAGELSVKDGQKIAFMGDSITKAGPDKKGNLLTSDGVHMNPAGNRMMATGVLKAFGLSPEQLDKAVKSWDPVK